MAPTPAQKLRLSVALCTYDGGDYLQAQLDSYLAQERLPDELVVCDDGSKDGSVDRVRAFAARAPFEVRLVVNPVNLGATANFEQALRLCTGDVVALSDQDDVWLPAKLRLLEAPFLARPSVGAVFSDAEVVDAELRPLGRRMWPSVRFTPREQRRLRAGGALALLLNRNVVTGATLAVRASVRERFLPIPPRWVHDRWIALLLAMACDLDCVDAPLILYRQHARQALGAPDQTTSATVRRLGADPGAYAEVTHRSMLWEVGNFDVLLAHLAQTGAPAAVVRQVEAKRAHLLARLALPRSRLRRVPTVLRELGSGRYARYSSAWKSAVKDLWL